MQSIMQIHDHINYVFLGSQESLMQGIFENFKAIFYRFGYVMRLGKITETNFILYIANSLSSVTNQSDMLAGEILKKAQCHPYYTQQLACEI